MQTSLSLINLRARCLSMFQLQAQHRHAAGLIDLLFKERLIFLQLLCHTSRLLTSASKNPLLCKRLYNLCICYMYEHLSDYYNPYAL